MKSFIRENKEYLIFCLGILFAGLLYNLFGHSTIKIVYGPASHSDASLKYNLALADKIYFLILAGLSVCFLLYRLVFSKKKKALLWPTLIFVCILILVYKLSPNWRVYSAHGFTHAAVLYQILNGKIPPTNPLLAGEALFYPWGYECVAAAITSVFNITPFYSYAILNIASLVIVMFLIHKISRLLIKDDNANILSIIISIFGITIFNTYMLHLSRNINISMEWRGVPAFNKFSNVNGVPIGLVFYLIFLYSVIKILVDKKARFNSIFFSLSILGCGFIYPPFLPAIFASAICICIANIFFSRKKNSALCLRKSVLIIMLLVISTLIVVPYIFSISASRPTGIELFNIKFVVRNVVSYFTVCFPILLVIFMNRKFLSRYLDRRILTIIITAIAATFCCYAFTHMPLNVEYKALILSTVTLGILGGISLSAMRQWCNKNVIFILLLLFIFPSFNNIYTKLRRFDRLPVTYVEKGKYIYSKNTEENELYEWIRKETTKDDVFIDALPFLPVFAQRQLFVASDVSFIGEAGQFRIINPGYGFPFSIVLQTIYGCDPNLPESRKNIINSIYSLNRELTSEQINQLSTSSLNDIYVIIRKAIFQDTFNQQGFDEVFRSSKGNYLAYRCTKNVSR